MLSRRAFHAAAVAGAVWLLLPTARAAGPAAVEVVDLEWTDAARQRPVPVRLYLPADTAAPHPLVVFSHGIGGSRLGYSYLGRHWAAHGIAALHVQHVGSDRSLWGGNPLAMVQRLQDAARDTEALDRVHDLRFALDALLAGENAGRIDAARVVAAGHSYGANTAMLAVGAQVQRDGRTLDLRDPRFAAAVLLSAPPFYGEADPRRVLAPVAVPTLHVTATEDVIRIPGYWSGADDRLKVFDAIGSPQKWLAVFKGGSHSIFTDRAATGGLELNQQVKAATQALSLAFLQRVFGRSEAPLRGWAERFAPIVARYAEAAPG
jgi:predicted dienelactone hydrolase